MANKLTPREEEEKRKKALERERNKTPLERQQDEDKKVQAAAKKKEAEQKKKQTGFGSNPFSAFLRTLDTPRNVITSTIQNEDKLQGALRGLTRQDVVSSRDLIDPDRQGGIGTSVGGFAMDMALDPMTYAGAPILKGLGRGVKGSAKLTGKGIGKLAPVASGKIVDKFNTVKGSIKESGALKNLMNIVSTPVTRRNQILSKHNQLTDEARAGFEEFMTPFINGQPVNTVDKSLTDVILQRPADPANAGKVFTADADEIKYVLDVALRSKLGAMNQAPTLNTKALFDLNLAPGFKNFGKSRGKNQMLSLETYDDERFGMYIKSVEEQLKKALATYSPDISLPENMLHIHRGGLTEQQKISNAAIQQQIDAGGDIGNLKDRLYQDRILGVKINDMGYGNVDRQAIADAFNKAQEAGAFNNFDEGIASFNLGNRYTDTRNSAIQEALGAIGGQSGLSQLNAGLSTHATKYNELTNMLGEAFRNTGTNTSKLLGNILGKQGFLPGVADKNVRVSRKLGSLKKGSGDNVKHILFPNDEAAVRMTKLQNMTQELSDLSAEDGLRLLNDKYQFTPDQIEEIRRIAFNDANIAKLHSLNRGAGSATTFLSPDEALRRGFNRNVNSHDALKTFASTTGQAITDEKVLSDIVKHSLQPGFNPNTPGGVAAGFDTIDLKNSEAFLKKTPEFQAKQIADLGGKPGQTVFSVKKGHAPYVKALAEGAKVNQSGILQAPINNELLKVTGKSPMGFMTDETKQQLKNGLRAINSVVRKFMILSPGYHFRNQAGQLANMKAAGVKIGDIKGEYWKNLQPLLPGQGGTHDTEALKQFFTNYDKNPMGNGQVLNFDDMSQLEQMNIMDRVNDYMAPAMQQDSRGLMKLADANMKKTIQTDIAARMSLAEHYKKLGHADPYGEASKVIFSRGNFGKDNEDMLREMFLFSGFTLKNANFHMRNIQKNPQFYARTAGLVRNAQQNLAPSGEVPTFSEESGRVPIPLGNHSALQLSLDLPGYSAGRLIGNPTTGITQSLAPQYKSIIEMGTGNSTFTGLPIENKPRALLENFGGRNPLVLADTAYTTAVSNDRYQNMGDTQKNLSTLGGFIQPNYNRRDLRDPVNFLNLPGLPVTVIRDHTQLTPEEEELLRLRSLRGY